MCCFVLTDRDCLYSWSVFVDTKTWALIRLESKYPVYVSQHVFSVRGECVYTHQCVHTHTHTHRWTENCCRIFQKNKLVFIVKCSVSAHSKHGILKKEEKKDEDEVQNTWSMFMNRMETPSVTGWRRLASFIMLQLNTTRLYFQPIKTNSGLIHSYNWWVTCTVRTHGHGKDSR